MLSWNKLPIEVEISSSLNIFKSNLEIFNRKTIALKGCCSGNFWEISYEVMNRIEGLNYLENKIRHDRFLKITLVLLKRNLLLFVCKFFVAVIPDPRAARSLRFSPSVSLER